MLASIVSRCWIVVLGSISFLNKEGRWYIMRWGLMAIVLLVLFDGVPLGVGCMMEREEVRVDLVSCWFVILSAWLRGIVLLVRVRGVLHKGGERLGYEITVLLLTFFLVLCFVSSDIFWFYVFYEATLIPTRILILG